MKDRYVFLGMLIALAFALLAECVQADGFELKAGAGVEETQGGFVQASIPVPGYPPVQVHATAWTTPEGSNEREHNFALTGSYEFRWGALAFAAGGGVPLHRDSRVESPAIAHFELTYDVGRFVEVGVLHFSSVVDDPGRNWLFLGLSF